MNTNNKACGQMLQTITMIIITYKMALKKDEKNAH
jgi:hypothetical protein